MERVISSKIDVYVWHACVKTEGATSGSGHNYRLPLGPCFCKYNMKKRMHYSLSHIFACPIQVSWAHVIADIGPGL